MHFIHSFFIMLWNGSFEGPVDFILTTCWDMLDGGMRGPGLCDVCYFTSLLDDVRVL